MSNIRGKSATYVINIMFVKEWFKGRMGEDCLLQFAHENVGYRLGKFDSHCSVKVIQSFSLLSS